MFDDCYGTSSFFTCKLTETSWLLWKRLTVSCALNARETILLLIIFAFYISINDGPLQKKMQPGHSSLPTTSCCKKYLLISMKL